MPCLHRRVQRPKSWCRVQILLPTMWSEILCSLSSSIAVADGRVLVVCHVSRSLLIVVAEGRDFWLSATACEIDGIKYCCSAFFLVTAIVPSNWDSVSTLLLEGTYFLQKYFISNKSRYWDTNFVPCQLLFPHQYTVSVVSLYFHFHKL